MKKRWLHLSTYGVLLSVALGGWGLQQAYAGKVAPNTFALNANISLEEGETAQENLSLALEAFEAEPVTLLYRGSTYTFGLEELGITLKKTETIQSIPVIQSGVSPWSYEGGLLGEKYVVAQFEWDPVTFQTALESKIIDLNVAAAEPSITWNSARRDFDIAPEQDGWKADNEALIETLQSQIQQLDSAPIEIAFKTLYPLITAPELEASKETLKEKLASPTTLFTTTASWEIDWLDRLDLLDFEPIKTVEQNGRTVALTLDEYESFEPATDLTFESSIAVHLNPDMFHAYVEAEIAPDVLTEAQDVTILMDEETDLITFEGAAVDGTELKEASVIALLEHALENGIAQVELPLLYTQGRVNAPEALRDLGITELVGTGYSNYSGSPYNRQHNIAVATARFDGVLIGPGEDFSFGEQLGPVDGSTGYLKELVIKEEGTIPEYGGGVCQVSSTLYRAVLFTGLPIVERHPHSYAVSYYAYPLGWGLDATVYPPAVDFVFTNDTDHHLLIQAYTIGTDAYFKFYGTKDGRTVYMDGPYVSNSVGAPPAQYIVTPDLPAGTIEKKESAHNGFTATWTRVVNYPVGHTLYPEGQTFEETLVSPYRAMPAKYLVGEGTEGYGEEAAEE